LCRLRRHCYKSRLFLIVPMIHWPFSPPQSLFHEPFQRKITQLQANPVNSIPQISPNKALLMHHLTPNTWPFGQQTALPPPISLLLSPKRVLRPVPTLPRECWERKASTSVPSLGAEKKSEGTRRREKHSFIHKRDGKGNKILFKKRGPLSQRETERERRTASFKEGDILWMRDGSPYEAIHHSFNSPVGQRGGGVVPPPPPSGSSSIGREERRTAAMCWWSCDLYLPPSCEVSRESDYACLSPPPSPPPSLPPPPL